MKLNKLMDINYKGFVRDHNLYIEAKEEFEKNKLNFNLALASLSESDTCWSALNYIFATVSDLKLTKGNYKILFFDSETKEFVILFFDITDNTFIHFRYFDDYEGHPILIIQIIGDENE